MVIKLNARLSYSNDTFHVVPNTVPPMIEDKILQAFGDSIVEYEDILFERFQLMIDGIFQMSEFQDHLENMEERGILVYGEFFGLRAWIRDNFVDDPRFSAR